MSSPLAELERLEEPAGISGLYLLHFEPRYKHAGHYLGYSDSIGRRLAEHYSSGSKSSPLVRAALGAGARVELALVVPGADRTEERRLKNGGGLSRHCPICRARGEARR